jgi:toxin HigB-1
MSRPRSSTRSRIDWARIARHNVTRYYDRVIRGFRDSETERLFKRGPVRRFGSDVQRVALRRLRQLDAAVVLDDLRAPPGNRLEKLRGQREGQFSIRVNDQWRVCFRWSGGDAYEVEIVDYH